MLSEKTLEQYRQMTPGERLALTFEMLEYSFPQLTSGPTELVDRRFELLRRENDLRNKNMLEALARSKNEPD